MNYITQINGFWEKSESLNLTGIDIAVYMALLHYCNKLSWLNPFICHWDIMCQHSKVSKNAYYKSLERLEKAELIKYSKGLKNSNKKPKVFILELKNKEGIKKEQRGNKEGIKKEQRGNKEGIKKEQRGNIYKHDKLINYETNKREENSRALEFLKQKFPSRFETEYLMRYQSKILNIEKFEEDFEATVIFEKIEFEGKILFARLGKYARNWIENQKKYQNEKPEPTINRQTADTIRRNSEGW